MPLAVIGPNPGRNSSGAEWTPNGSVPYEHGAMEESLPVKTIGNEPGSEIASSPPPDELLLRNPFKNAPFQAVFWSGVSS